MHFQTLQKVTEYLENLLNTPGDPGDLHSILIHISQTALAFFKADSCFCFAFHPATQYLLEEYSMVISSQHQDNHAPLGPDPNLKILTDYVLHHSVVVVEDVNEQKSLNEPLRTFMQ